MLHVERVHCSQFVRILHSGDSAGGNLCISLALKCIELNIRKPDGVFSAYAPTVLQFYPSPSRFLGLMDPLLSFGFMMCSIKGNDNLYNDDDCNRAQYNAYEMGVKYSYSL